MDKATEFKKELKALLEKYNAEIYVFLDELRIDVDNKEIMKVTNCISHHNIEL